ncbi:MAG TPA: type II toxin-antitoxin system HigB family toxin [Nitrospirota bacterium]|nr:type II toxin-antitoxin system HigB family toxin [Nitrospirota bacterium]
MGIIPFANHNDSVVRPLSIHVPPHQARWHLDIYLIMRYCIGVHIITRKRLIEFSRKHPDARDPLNRWHTIIRKTDFASLVELKVTFPTADLVGKFTVFNIGGNKYRLIVAIHYNRKKVYIRYVLTHAEYVRNDWRK